MKKFLNAIAWTLAVNFLAVAGALAWLYRSGHLDRERVTVIKAVLFPPAPVEPPASQPAGPDVPAPASQRLAGLLAKHSARSAAEQVEFIQQSFDTTMAQVDRREREVADRESQVARANAKLVDDRKALEAERARLTEQEQAADRAAGDKGFQDTLNLYNTMTSRQVKGLFMSMDEASAAAYLDAMQPRTAAKIVKEFKLPDEVERVKKILDKMRHTPASAEPTTQEAKG